MSIFINAFIDAAEKEWSVINADGFWEEFSVGASAVTPVFRIAARRKGDPLGEGSFEILQRVDVGLFPIATTPIALVESYAHNAVHQLDAYRRADWRADFARRVAEGEPCEVF